MALTEEFEENFTSLKSLTNDSLTLVCRFYLAIFSLTNNDEK